MGQAALPISITAEANRLRALQLREGGAKYRQIAATMGISTTYAYQLVREGLATLHDEVMETAEQVKTIELSRLDELWYKLSRKLERQVTTLRGTDGKTIEVPNPDEKTVAAMVAIMKRRAEMLGTDAPQKFAGDADNPLFPMAANAKETFAKMVDEQYRRLQAVGGVTVVAIAPGGEIAQQVTSTHGERPDASEGLEAGDDVGSESASDGGAAGVDRGEFDEGRGEGAIGVPGRDPDAERHVHA